MDPSSDPPVALWLEVLRVSPALALVLVMWFQQRDQTKILQSIRDRLGRVLEHTRTTPHQGVPIRRQSSRHDSDSITPPNVPRTRTDEDL